MRKKYRFVTVLLFGLAIAAVGQQSSLPPVPAADSGPTLAATMRFIQEKLSEQGQVGWAETQSNRPGWTNRIIFNLADVMADPAACTLYFTETLDITVELPQGRVLKPGGPLTVDDLHSHNVVTETVSFKQVEKISVEKEEDAENQALAIAAHPDITTTVTPNTYFVKMWASTAVFASHTSTTKGKHELVEKDATSKTGGVATRDEDTANRVAKAMTHAVELCGGGVTKKELF